MPTPPTTPSPPAARHAVVVQHLAFEDLGSLAGVLQARGWTWSCLQAGVDDLAAAQQVTEADLLIVLGGPIGVYETETYPFLGEEIALLRTRLTAQRPTLGICLGAQLMAAALGARVYPGGRKEIGWSPLSLTPAGQASCLRHLAGTAVLHWHGDTFDLPDGCVHLAASAAYPHQAFAVGAHALALQCHPEARLRDFERWLIGHACELTSAGLDVPALRAEARTHAPALEAAAARMFGEWLDGLA
ncbi:MAG: glutamine amidotransferase [Proteobacteria bacterium]|uniref:glutamine amidotransferase n=1 Tax=Aquabacterium sp. TaxID=1872578 RepID=UPI0035C710BE|nr:glutamine amidotransferase [Pseudomonadota bacterium]